MSSKVVLYISYNGIREPLVFSQVIKYLEGLASFGYEFFLLTFERDNINRNDAANITAGLAEKNITWKGVPAANLFKPLSTCMDIIKGARIASNICKEYDVQLVHARSFVPALIARKVKLSKQIPYIFDIRGFWVDEKVYKGSLEQDSLIYRMAKCLEAEAYKKSDAIVSLTNTAIDEIKNKPFWKGIKKPPMVTIRTCVDINRFLSVGNKKQSSLTFGYIGSLGKGYQAEVVFDFFVAATQFIPDSKLLVITRTDHHWLKQLAEKKNIDLSLLEMKSVAPEDIHKEVAKMDLGISFLKPHYSVLAFCPTKLGEYLASGVPVVVNRGIGDLDKIVEENKVGILLDNFSPASINESFRDLKAMVRSDEVSRRCVATARKYFSLDQGVLRYHTLYKKILGIRN